MTFQQQAADAHAGLDETHAVAAGLGDADMQRVIGLAGQQAVRGHHARHVALDLMEMTMLWKSCFSSRRTW